MALTNEVNALHFEYVDETKANTILSSLSNLRAKDIWEINTVYWLKEQQQQQKTRMI